MMPPRRGGFVEPPRRTAVFQPIRTGSCPDPRPGTGREEFDPKIAFQPDSTKSSQAPPRRCVVQPWLVTVSFPRHPRSSAPAPEQAQRSRLGRPVDAPHTIARAAAAAAAHRLAITPTSSSLLTPRLSFRKEQPRDQRAGRRI